MFELLGDKSEFECFLEEWVNGFDYVVAKTSGSTGKPKEIRLLKTDMKISAQVTNSFFGISETSVLYCPLAINYIAGKMMLIRAREANCRLIIEQPTNHLKFEDLPKGTKIDLICIVPSQVPSLIENIVKGLEIKQVIIGGSPLSANYEQELMKYGVCGYVTYGMTETCSHVALRKIGEKHYNALPDITFSVDSNDCLIVKSKQRSFGELFTNDVVELLDEHSFKWLGRYDNVINSGGIKIHPEELEETLREIIPFPFAITSRPDDKWGEVPVILMETNDDELDTAEFLRRLKDTLARESVPKEIFRVIKLPLTQNGKIDRKAMKSLLRKP